MLLWRSVLLGMVRPSLSFSDSRPEFSQLQIYSLLFCFNSCYVFNIPPLSSGPYMVNALFFAFLQNAKVLSVIALTSLHWSCLFNNLSYQITNYSMMWLIPVSFLCRILTVTKCARIWKLQSALNRYYFKWTSNFIWKKNGEGLAVEGR